MKLGATSRGVRGIACVARNTVWRSTLGLTMRYVPFALFPFRAPYPHEPTYFTLLHSRVTFLAA